MCAVQGTSGDLDSVEQEKDGNSLENTTQHAVDVL